MADVFTTAAGFPVTMGFRVAMYGPCHTWECAGCGGIAGRKTAAAARASAEKHAAKCREVPAGGAR